MDNQELNNRGIENNEKTEHSSKNIPGDIIRKNNKSNPQLVAIFGILSILSFIGVLVLLTLFLTSNSKDSQTDSSQTAIYTGELRVAFVNTDSILLQYDYAKELEKNLTSYQASLESNYQSQGQKLQSDYENYLRTGDQLTLTEQKKREEDLTRRQQEFPMLQQKMMAQLQERQIKDNEKLLNAVYAFINDYNAKNQKFNIILSKSYISSTVLYADETFDITKEIIEGLNKEYKNIKGK